MAAPKTPLSDVKVSGGYEANPSKLDKRKLEPKASPTNNIGPVPSYLSIDERRCWREIVETAHPGTLSKADRLYIAHGARLLSRIQRMEDIEDHMPTIIRFEKFLSMMGMTPVDRVRVASKEEAPENAFDKFQNPFRAAA